MINRCIYNYISPKVFRASRARFGRVFRATFVKFTLKVALKVQLWNFEIFLGREFCKVYNEKSL